MILQVNIRSIVQELDIHQVEIIQTSIVKSYSALVINNIVIDAPVKHFLNQLFSFLCIGFTTLLCQSME